MQKIGMLALAMLSLFSPILHSQPLIEDAKKLTQLLSVNDGKSSQLSFEIVPNKRYVWRESKGNFSQYPGALNFTQGSVQNPYSQTLMDGDILAFHRVDPLNRDCEISMQWLVKGDSLKLISNQSDGIAKQSAFKIKHWTKESKLAR